MLKNQHFSFRVVLLAILAIIFGVSAYAEPQRSNIPFTQVQYWVGTGANKAILIVNYCNQNKALAWWIQVGRYQDGSTDARHYRFGRQ